MSSNQSEIQDVILSIFKNYEDLQRDNSEVIFDIPKSFKIIQKASEILKREPAVLQLNTQKTKSDFVIVGDIHGSLESLFKIFDTKGHPKKTRYLFLGDYVDRGNSSCEVMILLYSFKCLYPDNIHLIRGNHEFRDVTDYYGFKDECNKRVKRRKNGLTFSEGKLFYELITDSFKYFPICAILNNSIFCVHGGISSLLDNRRQLLSIQKVGIELDFNDVIQSELLWNDPSNSISLYEKSERGVGFVFGQEALNSFLRKLNFKLVIRGHQMEDDGYNWPFGETGGILTVFSSIEYCGFPNSAGLAVVSNKKNECKSLVDVVQMKADSDSNHYFKIVTKLILFSNLMRIFS